MRYNRTDSDTDKTHLKQILLSILRLQERAECQDKRIGELSARLAETDRRLEAALARIAELEAERETRLKADAEAKNLFTGPTGILARMGHMIADGLAGMSAERFAGIYALPVANKLSALPEPEAGTGFYSRLLSATWPVLSAITAPGFEERAASCPDVIPSLMRGLTDALSLAGIDVIYPSDTDADASLMQRTLPAGSPDVPALIRRSDHYIYAYGGTSDHRL